METGIIISQIFVLAIVVLIGIIASKFRILTSDSKNVLSKVIFNITLPLMLFTNFLKMDATPRLITNSFIVLLVSVFVVLFMFMFGWFTTRLVRIKGSDAAVFQTHSMFGNIIYLGVPLINALYGEEGLLYASMFILISNLIMWTGGVIVLTHGNAASWRKSIRKVINPNTVAIIMGLIFFMFSIRLPKILITPMSELGHATTWLAMLYIGAMLAFTNISGLLGKKDLYILSFNRLLLVPVILVFIFYLSGTIPGFSADRLVSSVIILEAAMPCMATVVIMAKELDADDRLAVGNVFVSTLLSILSLPLVVLIINRFL
jgi:predicted permease